MFYLLVLLVAYGTLLLRLPIWLDVVLFGLIVAAGAGGLALGALLWATDGGGGALFGTGLLLLLSRIRRLLKVVTETIWTPEGF